LSTGDTTNLTLAVRNPHFHFVKGDSELVFHLIADTEVRAGVQLPLVGPGG
jgi:hypothetical protein